MDSSEVRAGRSPSPLSVYIALNRKTPFPLSPCGNLNVYRPFNGSFEWVTLPSDKERIYFTIFSASIRLSSGCALMVTSPQLPLPPFMILWDNWDIAFLSFLYLLAI